MGPPRFIAVGNATVKVWSADEIGLNGDYLSRDGNGILVARVARNDRSARQSALTQVALLSALCAERCLLPREIIAITGQSASAGFSERWDFSRIESGIKSGWVNWVAYLNLDRISRDPKVIGEFLDLLERTETDLVLKGQASPPLSLSDLRYLSTFP